MKKDLKGKRILITAGPTREYIDPIRFLSNPSTGMMGYALAEAAKNRGAKVVLISGPTHLPPPRGVRTILVTSADEMYRAVMKHFSKSEIAIKTAAVADYRPVFTSNKKMKKGEKGLTLRMVRTRDILETMGKKKRGQILVGFAAESENLIRNAEAKIKKKGLDFIVANKIGPRGLGFGTTRHRVVIINSDGKLKKLKLQTKKSLANQVLNEASRRLYQ